MSRHLYLFLKFSLPSHDWLCEKVIFSRFRTYFVEVSLAMVKLIYHFLITISMITFYCFFFSYLSTVTVAVFPHSCSLIQKLFSKPSKTDNLFA